MKNSLGRYVPEGFIPFQSSRAFLEQPRTREKIILSENKGIKNFLQSVGHLIAWESVPI